MFLDEYDTCAWTTDSVSGKYVLGVISGDLGLGIWRSGGDLAIWGSGDLGIWGSGDLGIWRSGDLGVWRFGASGMTTSNPGIQGKWGKRGK